MKLTTVLNPLRAEIPSHLLEKQGFNNLYEMFDRSVGEDPDKSMARFKIRKGDWGSFSYREMKKGVLDSSAAMLGMGIKKGYRIAFVCKNRYEWMMLDLAIHRIGAVNVSNYVTPDPKKLVKSEIAFNINDSGSRIAFVGGDYLKKFLEMVDNGAVPSIEKVVCLDEEESVGKRKDLIALSDFLRSGKKNGKLLDDYKEKVALNDTATIIYTSGSTGVPKGVVLTHGNLLSNIENILEMVDVRHDDIELSFLPLGHVFERIISYLLIRKGGTVGYAQSIETLADDALVIKPTVFPAVPRVFEKFKAKIEANAQSKGGLSLKIYNWSLNVGSKVNKGKKDPITMMKYGIAKKLVFDKVVKKLGGRVRF
ncbi:MAG: AMP-binding protein, partial [Candidatus Krumholzibacteria bacterium]|nr:AMP-binding protein [Candidatus Krumholzibacteria bacterium]